MRKYFTAAAPVFWLALAVGGYALARFAPPLDGLSAPAQAVLGAAFAAAMLWVTEAVPLGLTALFVLLLLGLCPGVRFADAASGFAGEVTFFLIGAIGIGAAVEAAAWPSAWRGFSAAARAAARRGFTPSSSPAFRRWRC